jgi:hypothetical protein
MNDKELLELAAKAAGIEIIWSSEKDLAPRIKSVTGNSNRCWFSPLTDEGDALRLAVKLGLLVHGNSAPSTVFCQVGECPDAFLEHAKPDPYAATRRAIVRAAAEIGKGMK